MSWIDIKKQKPKPRQVILVWCEKTKTMPNIKTAIYVLCWSQMGNQEKVYRDVFMGVDFDDQSKIMHWQPLKAKKPKVSL